MVSGSERDAMEPELESGMFRVVAAGDLRTRWPYQVSDYQRLMVNPFLFVLAPLLFGLVHSLLRPVWIMPLPLIILIGFATWLGLSTTLIQYHCLDCGKTGPIRTWKSHACDSVKERAHHDERPWIRPPTASTQTKLWFLTLTTLLIGYLAYFRW